MKSFEQLAQSACAAYRKEMQCADPKTGAIWGTPCVPWEQLDIDRQQSWLAAVKQVVAEYAAVH
jgi:hypothetical protein